MKPGYHIIYILAILTLGVKLINARHEVRVYTEGLKLGTQYAVLAKLVKDANGPH